MYEEMSPETMTRQPCQCCSFRFSRSCTYFSLMAAETSHINSGLFGNRSPNQTHHIGKGLRRPPGCSSNSRMSAVMAQDMFNKKVQIRNLQIMDDHCKSEAPLLGRSKNTAQVAPVQTGHDTVLEDIKERKRWCKNDSDNCSSQNSKT